MRKIDETKRKLVVQAVFEVTYEEGITNLSIGKIAKKAGVSKATIYVYFENKTDMLGKIYLEVKRRTDEGLSEKLRDSDSYKVKVRNVLEHFARHFVAHPLESNFMRSVQSNCNLVDPEVLETSEKMAQPVTDLFEEGVKSNQWVTNNPIILFAILLSPLVQIIEYYFRKGQSVPDNELTELLDILVKNSLVD
ncbi:TetR/AcrR family transcriptional regulator [Companilactobacillus jidongensis]|uniref:TetR/AcrR family transcriptional regulator n=1 Tax=Companilactobacillus jidongensis TaxID=2486006 RepID=UPI000F7B6C89|nr:TetR/AcrR family transcriptional regulator [Companilactobacillus jidongensis]